MKSVAALSLGAALFVSPVLADSAPQPTPMSNGTIVYSAPIVTSQEQVVQGLPYVTAPQSAAPQYAAPQYNAPQYGAPEQSFFGRLMEMERRKNAWLRRTFLGQ